MDGVGVYGAELVDESSWAALLNVRLITERFRLEELWVSLFHLEVQRWTLFHVPAPPPTVSSLFPVFWLLFFPDRELAHPLWFTQINLCTLLGILLSIIYTVCHGISGGPALAPILRMQPHQCWIEGHDHLSFPSGNILPNEAKNTTGLLSIRTHCWLMLSSVPPGPSCRAASSWMLQVFGAGVVPLQEQHSALPHVYGGEHNAGLSSSVF